MCVCGCVQITIAHVLWKQGKLREALSAAKTAHQGALRALGPNAYHVNLPLSCYWRLLYVMVGDTCISNKPI